jgi:hypothetical protein
VGWFRHGPIGYEPGLKSPIVKAQKRKHVMIELTLHHLNLKSTREVIDWYGGGVGATVSLQCKNIAFIRMIAVVTASPFLPLLQDSYAKPSTTSSLTPLGLP